MSAWCRAGIGLVLLGATALVGSAPALADALSPQTGARVETTGNPSAAGGTVYYVDAVNGVDSNPGTLAAPWRTLAKVDSTTFGPGDVVAFHRGQTFTGSATIDNAGTAASPIVLTAYSTGAQPVLTNPGQWFMLRIDAANVKVDNLAFTNGAVFDNADGLGIVGAKYERSGAVAISPNGINAIVEDSTFTDVGVGVKTYGLNSKVQHNTFKDLRIAFRGFDSGSETSYGALGVSVDNSGVDVSYNDFINCRSTNSPYGADGGAVEIEGFLFDKDNVTIHHNYSRGSQGFLEVTETHSSNVSVTENVSDDYQQFIAWDTTTTPSGYLAANNTVVRSSDSAKLFDVYYYRQAGPSPSASWLTIRNNVFSTAAQLSNYPYPHDHNLFDTSVTVGSALGPGDIVASPRFAASASRDYRLSTYSPAIDNGTTPVASTDLFGGSTSVGLGSDMGAHEYSTAATAGTTVVMDGGFETQTSVTSLTTPWWSQGSSSYGVDVAAGKSHSGADNGWVATAGTGWGALRQTVTVSANSNYRLTVWVRSSSNLNDVWLGAKTTSDAVVSEIHHGAATGYTRYVLTFNSGANTSLRLHIGMWGAGAGSWLQVDDVALQQV